MQCVAAGSDHDLALAAKSYLTDQYETNHTDAILFSDEPSCNGRRLGQWLRTRVEDGADFTPAAKTAIKQLGTNAIPALLKRLTYVRPPYCFSPIQINLDAAAGFIALSEQAGPVLPKLWTLMDSTHKEVALAAMIASFGTGSNALPFFIKGLTNSFPEVRSCAANVLSGGSAKRFPELSHPALPLLAKLLTDPDADVRANATNALKELDPVLAAQTGIK